MLNFFISIFVFAAAVFLLGVSIRYGLKGAGKLDEYFSTKSNKNFTGFNWYYRIPFSIGFIPEYFFYLVIGRENYFKVNWWPLKTSAFISMLLAIATVKSRTSVFEYYSLEMIRQQSFLSLFTSGSFTWYLNIISVLFIALLVLIIVESVKMHGIYSPVRILVYSLLSILMAQLTIIVLALIVAISLIYFAFKIIIFLFFSSKREKYREQEEPENETSGAIRKNLAAFKAEVFEWEKEIRNVHSENKETTKPKIKIRRKKTIIKPTSYKEDIPRLHPD